MGVRRGWSAWAGWRDEETKINNNEEERRMEKERGFEAGACMAFNFKSIIICMPLPPMHCSEIHL